MGDGGIFRLGIGHTSSRMFASSQDKFCNIFRVACSRLDLLVDLMRDPEPKNMDAGCGIDKSGLGEG